MADKIHTIPIIIEYSRSDCRRGKKWLISDILKDAEKELNARIKKPVKATIVIMYNAIDGNLKGGKPYDNDRGRGQRKKQDKDRGKTIQHAQRCNT